MARFEGERRGFGGRRGDVGAGVYVRVAKVNEKDGGGIDVQGVRGDVEW